MSVHAPLTCQAVLELYVAPVALDRLVGQKVLFSLFFYIAWIVNGRRDVVDSYYECEFNQLLNITVNSLSSMVFNLSSWVFGPRLTIN